VLGLTETGSFNEYARIALAWTRGVLTADNYEILRTSPLKSEIARGILPWCMPPPVSLSSGIIF